MGATLICISSLLLNVTLPTKQNKNISQTKRQITLNNRNRLETLENGRCRYTIKGTTPKQSTEASSKSRGDSGFNGAWSVTQSRGPVLYKIQAIRSLSPLRTESDDAASRLAAISNISTCRYQSLPFQLVIYYKAEVAFVLRQLDFLSVP